LTPDVRGGCAEGSHSPRASGYGGSGGDALNSRGGVTPKTRPKATPASIPESQRVPGWPECPLFEPPRTALRESTRADHAERTCFPARRSRGDRTSCRIPAHRCRLRLLRCSVPQRPSAACRRASGRKNASNETRPCVEHVNFPRADGCTGSPAPPITRARRGPGSGDSDGESGGACS
jgi:hypothetical protein